MIVLLVTAGVLAAQSPPVVGTRFDNQYMTMTIRRGWVVSPSVDQKLNLLKGKYLLTIHPIFGHASGVEGGRLSEIVKGMPSVDAVAGKCRSAGERL
jgi:hypothetical protein